MSNDANAPALNQAADDQQSRHTAQTAAMIDEDSESWITLMMGLDAAKEKPELRTEFEEKLPPEVLRAANECSSYEDFKQRLDRYQAETTQCVM